VDFTRIDNLQQDFRDSMIKNSVLQRLTYLCIALCVLGCAKDVDKFIPDPIITYKGDIGRFFEAAREDLTQTTPINIDFPTAVVTPRKTVLIFQPKSLLDPKGKEVSGEVQIHILELLTRGEILLYGIPTHSHGKLLSSGGEFFVTASQDGAPLKLKHGAPVRILTDVKGSPQMRMELFYGNETNTPDETSTTWDEADGNPSVWNNIAVTEWVALADSQQIITGFGYECFSDSLDWINFDVFENIPQSQRTNVCITLPEEYGNVNTIIFMVFKDLKSVLMLPGDPLQKRFCNFYQQSIQVPVPTGAPVTFLVISEQGDDTYYFVRKESVLEQGHEEFLFPVKTELAVIQSAIEKL
jgi:hypothetical protein